MNEPAIRRAFVGFLVAGIVVRLVAAWYSQGIHHFDEHQQYLEQAFRRVHGYGQTFWEQERGMRHPLYHVTLSYLLRVLEVATHNPTALAAMIRAVHGLLALGVLAIVAWSLIREGRAVAGLFLMFMLAVSADIVYIQIRTLSENAMTVPLVGALLLWRKKPLLAGTLLAVMVALRLQAGILVFAFWVASLALDWKSRKFAQTLWLSAGILAGMLAIGAMDYAAHGRWFHSARMNVQSNLVEGTAAERFGTLPFYYYLLRGGWFLFTVSVLAGPLMLVGFWKRPSLAWFVGLFVVVHSAIGHKEHRFLWGVIPLVCIAIALGFEELWVRMTKGKWVITGLVAATFLVTGAVRTFYVRWRDDPFHGSAVALARLSRERDVTGVAIGGTQPWTCGNYFYLRHDVPIVHIPAELPARVNYVILSPGFPRPDGLREFATCDGWTIFTRSP